MFGRKFLLLPVLATAIAGPYMFYSDDWQGNVKKQWASIVGEKKSSGTESSKTNFFADDEFKSRNPANAFNAIELSSKQIELEEVIRFDIDPHWVTNRWPRVTTTLAELELEGMRVPIVTGTRADDVSGSLTYYFNKEHQVQRITLYGFTGDERKLAALLTKQYDFRNTPSLDAGLYLQSWNNRPTGLLRVTHAPVVNAKEPNSQLKIMMEINRPSAYYRLSESARSILDQKKKARRW